MADETEYVWQEYPKWITLPNGKQIIVDSATAERTALGLPEEEISFNEPADPLADIPNALMAVLDPPPADNDHVADGAIQFPETDARALLEEEATDLGIKVDRRWSDDTLRTKIADAK